MISQEWFNQLQQQYPSPIPCPDEVRGKPDLYCVIGAFLRFRHGGIGMGFPGCSDGSSEIKLINDSLSWEDAYDIAESIIVTNDRGAITAAWQLLRNAIVE